MCGVFRILCHLTKNARKKTKQGSALATPFSRRTSDVRRGLSFMKKGRRGHNAALGWLVNFWITHFCVKRIYYFVMPNLLMRIIFIPKLCDMTILLTLKF